MSIVLLVGSAIWIAVAMNTHVVVDHVFNVYYI